METTVHLDKIIPFYINPGEKQLFGLYYEPPLGLKQDYGVVLCGPMGQEYIRAHRALSQWAIRLSREGFPVLRFDFYGQGDSAGEDEDGTLTQWKADIRSAIQELKRRARVESLFIGGLRLGASLAAVVSSGRDDIEGVVLWDPILNGRDYLEELTHWHTEKLMNFLTDVEIEVNGVSQQKELVGFRISEVLRSEIQAFDLGIIQRKPAEKVLLIGSQTQPDLSGCVDLLKGIGSKVDYRIIESFKMWEENPDKGLVPQPILQAAITWILQESV